MTDHPPHQHWLGLANLPQVWAGQLAQWCRRGLASGRWPDDGHFSPAACASRLLRRQPSPTGTEHLEQRPKCRDESLHGINLFQLLIGQIPGSVISSSPFVNLARRSRGRSRGQTTFDGLGVVGEVQHELLPSTDALQVGVIGVAPPASAVGVVGQRRLVAVGIEPPREPPI